MLIPPNNVTLYCLQIFGNQYSVWISPNILPQHISVTVSVLTLVIISFERWQAICRPFHVKRTHSRSCGILAVVWIVAFLICLPQLFSMNVARFEKLPPTYLLFTECKSSWNREVLLPLKYIEMVVLFFLPFSWMGVAYIWIVRELWCVRRRQMTTKSMFFAVYLLIISDYICSYSLIISEFSFLFSHYPSTSEPLAHTKSSSIAACDPREGKFRTTR